MSKFIVVVFSDQAKAVEGVSALNQLHRDGSITLYGTTVIERDHEGTLSIKERTDEGPIGAGVGALVGALTGVFAGPLGVGLGMGAGVLAGGLRDVIHVEISDDFLESVERELTPGKFAVVAELSEEWVAPVDVRMTELGGQVVLRELRHDFISDQFEKRAEARRKEKEMLKAERAGTKAEKMAAQVSAEIAATEKKLERSAQKARERLDDTKAEMQAKLRALEEQAAKATPEAQQRIQERITETRRDLAEREQKLTRALELAHEAIHA